MTPSEWVQIVLMGLLVVITGIYAWRTFAISNATKKQADASVKMARETKEQRYSESLPLLVPDITRRGVIEQNLEPNEVYYQTLQTGVGIEVIWHNLGKGVAINSRFSFWSAPLDSPPGKVLYFPPSKSTFLEIGGRKDITIDKTWVGQLCGIPEGYFPLLGAEYQDIYERKIVTVQEFRIDEQNKKAFLGDLYFKVNDKRLGEEECKNHD